MEYINWANYRWLTRIHNAERYTGPERKYWADDNAISVDSLGYLHLKTRYNPRQFKHGKPLIGAGLISSEKRFMHGTFDISCQLPKGKWLWPAYWCIGGKTWPPEVDMFEGYSDKKGSYRDFHWLNPFAPWNIETNAWYGTPTSLKQIGAKQHSKVNGDPSSRFEYYKLEWTPKKMKIYFGKNVVREIDNKEILSKCNEQGIYIIMNNGICDDANGLENHQPSDFVVKYFSYKPL